MQAIFLKKQKRIIYYIFTIFFHTLYLKELSTDPAALSVVCYQYFFSKVYSFYKSITIINNKKIYDNICLTNLFIAIYTLLFKRFPVFSVRLYCISVHKKPVLYLSQTA